jgi:hypothetical protein
MLPDVSLVAAGQAAAVGARALCVVVDVRTPTSHWNSTGDVICLLFGVPCFCLIPTMNEDEDEVIQEVLFLSNRLHSSVKMSNDVFLEQRGYS